LLLCSAGVTIPAVVKRGQQYETQIRHVTIDRAGLLDYAEMSYTAGLRIDYNYYGISYLKVINGVSDGINIQYSHPYAPNTLEKCNIDNNLGNGLLIRSPFLKVDDTTMNNNDKSGFEYDPFFTEYTALSVRNFIYQNDDYLKSILDNPVIHMGQDTMLFLMCPAGGDGTPRTHYTELSVISTFRLTLQILDYNPLTSVERVTIFDSPRDAIVSNTKRWEIEEDLVDFPIVSRSNIITIRLQAFGVRSGRLSFAAISRTYINCVSVMLILFRSGF
jgi:hypothetical protein